MGIIDWIIRELDKRSLEKIEEKLAMLSAKRDEMLRFKSAESDRSLPYWFVKERINMAGEISYLTFKKKALEKKLGISQLPEKP